MPKKLAITISGAVSLGSYEAGVLYEVLSALSQHNSDPATPEADKVYIDVITGASAGGMTAAIVTHKLLYEAGALEEPYNNAIYQAWVAEVSIEGLLNMHGEDKSTMSILSSQAIVDISKKLLTDRYANVPPPRSQHPAVDADHLSLGLALANLNGVDYSLSVLPSGSVTYTRHKDEFIHRFPGIKRANDDNGPLWDSLRAAAVSCGAFPFAFRVVELARSAEDFELPDQANPLPPVQQFAYTDGGTFQNEPISLAKRLVDEIDQHLGLEQRFFLFVAPDLKPSAANSKFNAATAHFLPTASRLLSAIFNQARFPDLVLAEEKNREVALLNNRAQKLAELLHLPGGQELAGSLKAAAEPLLAALFEFADPKASKETTEKARERLREQFHEIYNNGVDPNARDAWVQVRDVWVDAILTLERAAGLNETDEMTIYSIVASDEELAGADLMAFGGFFDRGYREHDYEVGREKAQQFLMSKGILGLPNGLRWMPAINRRKDPSLAGLKLRKMDRGIRESVRDQVMDRVNVALIDMGVTLPVLGPVVRSVVEEFIEPKLNELLELKD